MRRRGYALAEVLLVLVVMTFVLFTMVTIFPTCMASLRQSQSTGVASNLGCKVMEQWKNQDFASLKNITAPRVTRDTLNGVDYIETMTVKTTPDTNVLRLQVQVQWWSGTGTGPTTQVFNTLVFNQVNPW